MKKKEKLQINSIMEVAAKPTYYVAAVIEGMGIEIVNGFAVVGNIEVDLRFENLPPQIRRYKNEQSKKDMAQLIEIRAEGTQEDYSVLSEKSLFESDNIEDVMFEYRQEIDSYRRAGAEVVEDGKGRAFVVDSSNRVKKIIDVQ